MISKKVLYKDKARKALAKGILIMVEAVSVTLGPKGRNVVLSKRRNSPQIVNDGVTIAKEVNLHNPMQNTGVSLIRQAAAKTNDTAGDGTTTSTVLAHSIVYEGMKNIAAGINPIGLKLGIEKATKYLIEQIYEFARPIENIISISNVASISSGNDLEIGDIISSALNEVGRDGIISLEDGKSTETELEISEGMRFDKGFISPYFVTNPKKMQVIFENPYILLTNKKITLVKQDVIPILERITPTKRPFLLIVADIEKEALSTLVLNKLRGKVPLAVVRAPGFGEMREDALNDLTLLTNGKLFSEDSGYTLKKASLELLGECRRAIITRTDTTIINDKTLEDVRIQCENLRRQLAFSDDLFEKERLKARIARLSGGVAIIKIGAITETELKEKKLRLEDAINATRAAVEEGIVPGGGTTFAHLSENLRSWAKSNLQEEEFLGAIIITFTVELLLK